MTEQMQWTPHSEKQERALFSDKPITIVSTGIQWGKTSCGAMRIKMLMHQYTDERDNFLICAPTYKIMQQATLPEFLRVMKGCGEYQKVDAVFRMHNGGTCWLRTGTDANSVVGITNIRGVWGDEAGLYSLYFHENIQARASIKQAPIIYTTSPYTLNWVYTDYIRPHLKGMLHKDAMVIQAKSNDNPYFPKGEYERKKETMDPRRFNMMYGGEFHKMEGLVYDCFDQDVHVVSRKLLNPDTTTYVCGVDWGFTNLCAIVVLAVTKEEGTYLVAEYARPGKTIGELVEVAQKLKTIYNVKRFYCDPSSPHNITEFNKGKLTAIAADNQIRPGIDATYELIKAGRFHVFEGRAPHFMDEISMYHYPTPADISADKDIKEQLPVKQNDHVMDALRYVCYALKKTKGNFSTIDPVIPNVRTIDKRLHYYDHVLKQKDNNDNYDWQSALIYPYECQNGHEFEIIKSVRDIDLEEKCPTCSLVAMRTIAKRQSFAGATDWDTRHYSPALGRVVKSNAEARKIAKERGLIEIGNEDPDKMHKTFAAEREKKADRNMTLDATVEVRSHT